MELRDLETIINKAKMTKEDKNLLRAEADRLGIEYVMKKGCKSCWDKLITKLYEAMRHDTLNVSADGYRFKRHGMGFRTHGGEVYTNDNIRTKTVGKLNACIISSYFVKVEDDGNDGDL